MLTAYQPSYDFRLFDIPFFSALQAQEYGAETVFRSSDPAWFVDYSLDRLFNLGGSQQFFQQPATTAQAEADAKAKEEEFRRAVNIWDMIRGRTARGGEGTGPIVGSDKVVSDGPGTLAESKAGQQVKDWLKTLPAGSGTFLIAIVVIVLLILFVRR